MINKHQMSSIQNWNIDLLIKKCEIEIANNITHPKADNILELILNSFMDTINATAGLDTRTATSWFFAMFAWTVGTSAHCDILLSDDWANLATTTVAIAYLHNGIILGDNDNSTCHDSSTNCLKAQWVCHAFKLINRNDTALNNVTRPLYTPNLQSNADVLIRTMSKMKPQAERFTKAILHPWFNSNPCPKHDNDGYLQSTYPVYQSMLYIDNNPEVLDEWTNAIFNVITFTKGPNVQLINLVHNEMSTCFQLDNMNTICKSLLNDNNEIEITDIKKWPTIAETTNTLTCRRRK